MASLITKKNKRLRCDGYSLVELVVAAVCLGIGISGVMTMIGSGRQLETGHSLRRQASMFIQNELESDTYHHTNYEALNPLPMVVGPSAIVLNPGQANPVPATLSGNVILDSVQWNDPGVAPPLLWVVYKRIDFVVRWTFAGRIDSVVASKRIARMQ